MIIEEKENTHGHFIYNYIRKIFFWENSYNIHSSSFCRCNIFRNFAFSLCVNRDVISFTFTYTHFAGNEYFRLICLRLDQVDGQISTVVHESNKELTILFGEIFV